VERIIFFGPRFSLIFSDTRVSCVFFKLFFKKTLFVSPLQVYFEAFLLLKGTLDYTSL